MDVTERAVRVRRCGGSGAEDDVLRQHRRSSALPPAGRRVRLRRRRPAPSLTLKQKPAKEIPGLRIEPRSLITGTDAYPLRYPGVRAIVSKTVHIAIS